MTNAEIVARTLAERAEPVATALLGNPTSRTRSELRWGNRGSLALTIVGHKRGQWFDFEAGEGGDLLHLIARERRVRLGEAIRIAERDFGARPEPLRRPAAPPAEPSVEQISAKAMRLWRRAAPADSQHPYLVRKRVRPHGIGQLGDSLVIPVQRPAQLVGLQFISPDGTKRFMRGTIKRGAYHILGDPSLRPALLVFSEGYATAAAIHESCQVPVVCAFDAGNLLPVAECLRRIFPVSAFVFAEDADAAGKRGCRAAALATGGLIMSMEAA